MDEMNCNELVERVTDCLEEALDPETLMRLLDHLQICKGCDEYFNQILVALKIIANLPSYSMSPELEKSLMALTADTPESGVA